MPLKEPQSMEELIYFTNRTLEGGKGKMNLLFNIRQFFSFFIKIVWFDDRDGKNMPKGTFFSGGQKEWNW